MNLHRLRLPFASRARVQTTPREEQKKHGTRRCRAEILQVNIPRIPIHALGGHRRVASTKTTLSKWRNAPAATHHTTRTKTPLDEPNRRLLAFLLPNDPEPGRGEPPTSTPISCRGTRRARSILLSYVVMTDFPTTHYSSNGRDKVAISFLIGHFFVKGTWCEPPFK